MEFVRLMPMVHDTEIDAVNSTFAAAAAVAMQSVYFFLKETKMNESKCKPKGEKEPL